MTRRLLDYGKQTLIDAYVVVSRRLGMLGGSWAKSLPSEIPFWEKALANQGRDWRPGAFRERTDPELELQDHLKALIQAPEGAVVRILDIGAGPLTNLGKRWRGRDLRIVPLDPLANEFNALLARLSVRPPVATLQGVGEKLVERFGENSFDLVHSSNALDHTEDPVVVIRQMLAVVKPGGLVYLTHFSDEGRSEGYYGIHQWNFHEHRGDMVISDGRGKRTTATREFGHLASITCEPGTHFEKKTVVAKLRKLAPPS